MSDFNKVFFDTNPLIYYLENDGTFYEKMSKFIVDHADSAFSTSAVTVVEYLTGAFREGDKEKEQDFRSMISDYKFELFLLDGMLRKKQHESEKGIGVLRRWIHSNLQLRSSLVLISSSPMTYSLSSIQMSRCLLWMR